MYKEDKGQESFFSGYLYDQAVPKDNFLRKLSQAVDLSFVNQLCSKAYSEIGRPGYEPLKLFKILLLQHLFDLSDRKIMGEVGDRLSFRWFCGFAGDEALPDFCILSRFRDRIGTELLSEIFNKIVKKARRRGLISDRLHIIDATDMKAKVDSWKARDKEPADKDARRGSKGGGKWFFGYKAHTNMDAKSRIITKISVTPGNVSDGEVLPDVVDPKARMVTADKAYDTDLNHRLLKSLSIISAIIIKSNRKKAEIASRANSPLRLAAKRKRRLIESKHAEMKRWHGLSVARYWGLAKTFVQTYLTAIAVNLKRIVLLEYKTKFATP